ncbi:carboxypeptidase regulatory-like domain-containing protein [Horticoccus sp. 23ND18S-11]|uniref:carboxypeptidase regulatory-like domain-containing protein n=1 Tax=Horticoccus sp. 23ND18S-11 TaxID=3391832 RepID=UPI0039C9CF5A
MNTPSFFTSIRRVTLVVALAAFAAAVACAQSVATGSVEGRVLNVRNGEYLERARVTVEGTGLETFTDSSGQYRLTNVPAGPARVRVFFTGLDVQTEAVVVTAGGTAQRDFSLEAGARRADSRSTDGVVKLGEFVVATSKEMDGAAIAINEQRFAASIKNVVSAEEFGAITDGNVGEFFKYLPGMNINVAGGEARQFSMNGVPAGNVPISVGGFDLAGASGSSTNRNVLLDQISLNNISRIEVLHTPTPESPGMALAGSVNMVPRSAFERSKPVFNYSAYLLMRDNHRELPFTKSPGPLNKNAAKTYPGWEMSYVVPVNKRFGFTLSAGNSTQYTPLDAMQTSWRGVGSATSAPTIVNGAITNPGNFPDTTPDKPYLTDYSVRDGGKISRRSSAGLTMDYKLTRNDTVSLAFQYAFSDKRRSNRTLHFQINQVLPGDFTPTSTRSAPGQAEIRMENDADGKVGTTWMPTLVWRHDGPVWKSEVGAGHSHSTNIFSDVDKGFFATPLARRTGVTIAFDDIFYLRPRRITVTAPNGAPIDPGVLDNYSLATGSSNQRPSSDLKRSAYANLRRDFVVREVPVTLKAGLDVRQQVRDLRRSAPTFTFVGADRRATTTPADPLGSDDRAGAALDVFNSQNTAPFGFGRIQWLDNTRFYSLYQSNPEYFTVDPNTRYRNEVTGSQHAAEVISSGYVRGDAAFFDRRLKLVGGVRAEQTNVSGEGALTDPTRAYQRDASGRILRNAAGAPLLMVPTNAGLAYSQLTFIDRGQRAEKEYLRLFPSLNASYNLRENLILRSAFYTSVGRPNFNQYAGALTLPDTENTPNASNANSRIGVNNAGIKAWSAKTTKVRLEYYFERVGNLSVGAWRRDFENFFGNVTFPATPEFLALYDLDPATYGAYPVATQYNVPTTVRMTGLDFEYKQALTFLPHWARGVQVFANASIVRTQGDAASNFDGFTPQTYNWGVSLSRPKFTLRGNWNYRGRQRGAVVTGRSIEPGTYNWNAKQLYVDLQADYTFTRKLALFAAIRNFGDSAPTDNKIFGPSTPSQARFRSREEVGALVTFGIKGTF